MRGPRSGLRQILATPGAEDMAGDLSGTQPESPTPMENTSLYLGAGCCPGQVSAIREIPHFTNDFTLVLQV